MAAILLIIEANKIGNKIRFAASKVDELGGNIP